MPKTPPLILPNSFPNWFNAADDHGDKPSFEKRSEEIQHILEADISSFTYTPSDEEEEEEDDTISDLGRSKLSQGSNRSHKRHHSDSSSSNNVVRDVNNLYRKPSSNKSSSQQRHRSATPAVVNENSSEQYQLEDDDMDEILDSQQHQSTTQQQTVNNEGGLTTDTQNAMEDDTFYVAIDQLTQEYQAYAEEYREFKRYVDSAKRELLDYINQKTPYFEERGAQLSQRWESLKEYI